ncbi:MAG: hypothetical protein IKA65_00205 [Lentisphaeria bacterium]|nr:hypothetical protein [Lentisphaeria bacterium]
MKQLVYTWLLLLCGILIFTGCSDMSTAGKRLEQQLKGIADNYMKNEFVKQVKLNSHCQSWQVAPDRLLLFGFDGSEVRKFDTAHNELNAMALARCYVGQELYMQCNSASWSNLVSVEHERYKYRCLITFNISETRRMWQHLPGVSIVNVALKTDKNEDQLKEELEKDALKYLPGEKFDFHYLYTRPGITQNRKYTVTIFACYDPALPGWIPEDPEIARDIKLQIKKPDWLDMSIDKFKKPTVLTLYKDFLYWKKSAEFHKNYDDGLFYRYGRWLNAEDAEAAGKLMDLVDNFKPDSADLEALTGFLHELSGYTELLSISQAKNKAVECARNLIQKWQNANDYKKLSYMAQLLDYNPDYKLIESGIKSLLERARATVKRRVNQQLGDYIAALKNAGNLLEEFVANKNMTPEQINIILVRQENNLKKICFNNADKISELFFRLRFNTLLKSGNIAEVNKLYEQPGRTELLKALEREVLTRCTNCRRGRQKCIYCAAAPGKCTKCEGKSEYSVCPVCRNNGLCEHCRGSLQIKCLQCSGRGFIILLNKAAKLIEADHRALQKIINDTAVDLENSRII